MVSVPHKYLTENPSHCTWINYYDQMVQRVKEAKLIMCQPQLMYGLPTTEFSWE